MSMYNWQQPDWPYFRYDLSALYETLLAIAEKAGTINGKILHLSTDLKTEALIDCVIEEAIKTSEIEGEYINRADVRSSIKSKLGLSRTKPVHDKRARDIIELMFNVRETFDKPLTENELFTWHLKLFAGTAAPNLKIACWRTDLEPMQIVSGHLGRRVVHYEAPPAKDVPKEMKDFIRWFNETAPGKPKVINFAPVRAAIAHLYFESIHPFEDGNGRIGRAIAEKALSQGFGYPVLLSLSQAIEAEKKSYYAALHSASKTNEITEWIHYFVKTLLVALRNVEVQINFSLKKSEFFKKFADKLNERQLKVIERMFQAGVKGFEGGISAKKYMRIAGTSKATATRDLQQLFEMNIFDRVGSGRSVRYELS